MKYFSAQNNGGGNVPGVQFETWDIIAGTAFGVYRTENPATIAALEAAKATSIKEITQAEYEDCLKKKHPRFKDLTQSDPHPVTSLPGVALKGPGAVVVQNSEPVEPEVVMPASTVATTEEALVVAPTAPAAPAAPVAPAPAPAEPQTDPVGRRISRGNR